MADLGGALRSFEKPLAGGNFLEIAPVAGERQRNGQGRDQQGQQVDLEHQHLLLDRGEEGTHRTEIEHRQDRADRGHEQQRDHRAAQT